MTTSKQPLTVYFVMLVAAAIFMLLACILMFIELYRYGSPWENPGIPRAAAAVRFERSVLS